ncbi:MAG: Squalene-hopene cyclase C-terminal domain-containing protein [Candidatus Nitrotoga sp. CP45]|nr:MAG: Squalene-hopene cyclase C-terminal domain-containing protein [Candidatus Nitrotoga sp. CP45]
MSLTNLLALPFRYRPWRPRHMRLILNDITAPAQPELDHTTHLAGVIDWLCRAQDIRDGQPDAGGVSAGWSFEDGWLPSYPETTGYIIETFLAANKVLERPDLEKRARRMIDWELSIQQNDGAFPGHFGEAGSRPVIFNTGQIMHGMLAGYLQLGRQECLAAAVKAGLWLIRQQDADGCWHRFEHNDVPHVYNTRGTWALAATGLIANEPELTQAARRNLDWALTQQTTSGWFCTNAFTPDKAPFTHTIAYAIRGFLESGILLEDERYLSAALAAARGMARVQRADGWLAGTYTDNWIPCANYSCLTGVAQMSLNWTRLAQDGNAPEFRENARRAIGYVKRAQRLDDADEVARGGIAGSSPIWGDYSRFEYPNWAAKFFADALMMDMHDCVIPPVATRIAKTGGGSHG